MREGAGGEEERERGAQGSGKDFYVGLCFQILL